MAEIVWKKDLMASQKMERLARPNLAFLMNAFPRTTFQEYTCYDLRTSHWAHLLDTLIGPILRLSVSSTSDPSA